jgi:hypothetical protein
VKCEVFERLVLCFGSFLPLRDQFLFQCPS